MMTREDHLAWAKARALRYCEIGQLNEAFTSFASALKKHPDLEGHLALEFGMTLLLAGHLDTEQKMREFINGCR